MTRNAAGREIPDELNGTTLRPYRGAFEEVPEGNRTAPRIKHTRPGDIKVLPSIDEAIERSGLRDGMTISFHHHLRYGDMVLNMVLERIATAGIRSTDGSPRTASSGGASSSRRRRSG